MALLRQFPNQVRALALLCAAALLFVAATEVRAQSHSEFTIFEPSEELLWHDASSGFTTSPSQLTLSGPFTSRLPIASAPKQTGGLLQWTSAEGGEWKLVVASAGSRRKDASDYQSVEFLVNAPASIAATNLPKIRLESSLNYDSSAEEWGTFFSRGRR